MLANFARGFTGTRAELDKMMGQLGEVAKAEIGFGGGAEGSRERSFSYGGNSDFMGASGNMDSGPSGRKGQSMHGQSASGSASGAAKRGSKACVACE